MLIYFNLNILNKWHIENKKLKMFQSSHTYDKYINGMIGRLIMSIASSLHLLLKGKITGISGTLFRTISLGD